MFDEPPRADLLVFIESKGPAAPTTAAAPPGQALGRR
jgi:hypothetical protein